MIIDIYNVRRHSMHASFIERSYQPRQIIHISLINDMLSSQSFLMQLRHGVQWLKYEVYHKSEATQTNNDCSTESSLCVVLMWRHNLAVCKECARLSRQSRPLLPAHIPRLSRAWNRNTTLLHHRIQKSITYYYFSVKIPHTVGSLNFPLPPSLRAGSLARIPKQAGA